MLRRIVELLYACLFWLGVAVVTALVFMLVVAYVRLMVRWYYPPVPMESAYVDRVEELPR